MPKIALEVITDAFGLSQIYGEDFENLTSSQLKKGLSALQYVIAEKTVDDSQNPYYRKTTFTMNYGDKSYFVEGLTEVSTLTFFIDSVRYACYEMSREQFDGSYRANNVYTLPLTFFMERSEGGGTVYVYPFPNQTYEFELWGKFAMTEVTSYYQDMSLSYDNFYIDYLTFMMSRRLCLSYGFEVPQTVTSEINRKEQIMANTVGPLDTACAIIPTSVPPSMINYAQVWFATNGFVPNGRF